MFKAGDTVRHVRVNDTGNGVIRIVTRREIVPGRYGVVEIGEQAKGLAPIRISNRNGELRYTTAEELREAAHVLNQIAEALEDA